MNIRNLGHKIWDLIFEYSVHVSSLAFIALTVIDISNINIWEVEVFGVPKFAIGKLIYYFCVLVAIIFAIYSLSHSNNIKDLELKNKENDLKISDLENALNEVVSETNELFNSYLKLLSKNLNFSHNERISVYKVYKNEFIMIGRASESPNLKKPGRNKYPISDGFIGKGWDEGEFYINNLPDPDNRNGTSYYNAIIEHTKIAKEIVDSLKMKSRTYYVYRMDGFDNEPKALLVAESKNEAAFTKADIQDKLEGVSQPLVMFIEKVNPKANQIDELNKIGL